MATRTPPFYFDRKLQYTNGPAYITARCHFTHVMLWYFLSRPTPRSGEHDTQLRVQISKQTPPWYGTYQPNRDSIYLSDTTLQLPTVVSHKLSPAGISCAVLYGQKYRSIPASPPVIHVLSGTTIREGQNAAHSQPHPNNAKYQSPGYNPSRCFLTCRRQNATAITHKPPHTRFYVCERKGQLDGWTIDKCVNWLDMTHFSIQQILQSSTPNKTLSVISASLAIRSPCSSSTLKRGQNLKCCALQMLLLQRVIVSQTL